MSFIPISTYTGVHRSARVFGMCMFVYMMYVFIRDL